MKKSLGIFLAILFFIMACPVAAEENGLLYYHPQYTSLSEFKDGIAVYTLNEQIGFLDMNGKESILPTSGEYLWHGYNAVILRDADMIYGYTYTKEKLFEFKCKSVYDIHERMIVVEVGENIGVIDFQGQTVFPLGEYDAVRIKDSALIWYLKNDIWYEYSLANESTKELVYDPLISLSDSRYIGVDTYIGIFENNNVIMEPEYTSYFVSGDDYVFVGNDGSSIYNTVSGRVTKLDGKRLIDYNELGYTYYSISDDLVYYASHDKTVSCKYNMMHVSAPSEGYMVTSAESDQYSYCTISGVKSTEKTWNMAYPSKKGYALCFDYVDSSKTNTQWHIIDKTFNIVKTLDYDVYVDTTYPASTDFSDGYIRTIDRDTGLMGFIRLDEFDWNVETRLLGDVNGDGLITANDATVIMKHLSGMQDITDEVSLSCADVNNDGILTANDATKLMKYLAGMINSLE